MGPYIIGIFERKEKKKEKEKMNARKCLKFENRPGWFFSWKMLCGQCQNQ
jgi:hypothetical protein